MTSIIKTEVYGSIIVECFYKYYGESCQFFVSVNSDNIVQPSWERQILSCHGSFAGAQHNVNWCFKVHQCVVKHIRKKMKKGTTRLLRSTKYRKLYDAQEGKCYLCREPLSVYDCSIDHVVPLSKKGKDTIRNILLTHAKCNSVKSDRYPTTKEVDYAKEVHQKAKEINYVKVL